jgi:hypothetical protein
VLRAAEERREAGVRVEAREAAPADRAVPVNERRRLEIGQERVVLHQSAHPFVLTRPSAATRGKLVDVLILDRALCFGTDGLLRVLSS